MRMGQGVRTGLGHGGITCVLQTQFSSSPIIRMHIIHKVIIFPLDRKLNSKSKIWLSHLRDVTHSL